VEFDAVFAEVEGRLFGLSVLTRAGRPVVSLLRLGTGRCE
jgi:hypothetical protein